MSDDCSASHDATGYDFSSARYFMGADRVQADAIFREVEKRQDYAAPLRQPQGETT